ncbi:ankyrin, partial [Zopfia rhizophila CBS 207.26]
NGSDVNSLHGPYSSFLHFLTLKGYTDLLRLVDDKYNANLPLVNSHGRTLLQLAARGGHIDAFQYFISLGLNSRAKDAKGDSLLHYASSGGSLQIVNAVLDEGPMLPWQSGYWSPLHCACRTGNPKVVERLIKEG